MNTCDDDHTVTRLVDVASIRSGLASPADVIIE